MEDEDSKSEEEEVEDVDVDKAIVGDDNHKHEENKNGERLANLEKSVATLTTTLEELTNSI